MYLNEQFRMYQLAYKLVMNKNYKVLFINNKEEELWLEKHEGKTSKVIRILHKGFDWKNHLKADIARVFQKTKGLKRVLNGKKIEIHNIYMSSHVPIDDWEFLKKPLQLNEKKTPKMNVYYITDTNFHDEVARLQINIGVSLHKLNSVASDLEAEKYANYYKSEIAQALYREQDERDKVLSFGQPFLTYIFLVINLIMFFIIEANGGSTLENLIDFGAKYNPAIIDGEWWRIVSSMFLHIGLLHLFMNMLALYYLGIAVERIYGSLRFSLIYMFAGIGGGLTSFAFTVNVAAGASGAIFGLFGALLFFGLVHRRLFLQTIGRNLIIIVGINLVFGFIVPQVDNGAHVGGLITGFLVSAAVQLPRNKTTKIQATAFIAYIILVFSIVFIGLQNNDNVASYHLYKTEELVNGNNYEAAVERATEGLQEQTHLEAHLLFQRSYANIQLDNINLAIEDLEKSIDLDDTLPDAHYNLAILYYQIKEEEKAIYFINEAHNLNPENKDYIKLYEKITGESIQ